MRHNSMNIYPISVVLLSVLSSFSIKSAKADDKIDSIIKVCSSGIKNTKSTDEIIVLTREWMSTKGSISSKHLDGFELEIYRNIPREQSLDAYKAYVDCIKTMALDNSTQRDMKFGSRDIMINVFAEMDADSFGSALSHRDVKYKLSASVSMNNETKPNETKVCAWKLGDNKNVGSLVAEKVLYSGDESYFVVTRIGKDRSVEKYKLYVILSYQDKMIGKIIYIDATNKLDIKQHIPPEYIELVNSKKC